VAGLVRRWIEMDGRLLLVGLEREFWVALEEISRAEGLSIADLCRWIGGREPGMELSRATRSFSVDWMRMAAAGRQAGEA